ncbi:MAG TPA: P-loop NTPase [Thermoanaerobaculia bacterium]|nr:P-loop NTPase [Thermoanaerobaculia bacterium]HUM29045.1 P-loop NTPase [Thermoanaerobaculia bacterium]HXK67399.1 P-loop NTPase [Thermoanaerobaculia bacterium]
MMIDLPRKRIVTISSGKGGVGKTTFAINYALTLSRFAPTVLVDLDTGTSSIRNVIDLDVKYDIYHFLRRNRPMHECLTPFPEKWDPDGNYRNLGIVAGPTHYIDDIANLTAHNKDKIIDGVNNLPAKFIVLDMKAGVDPNVIDFLPFSNTGVLVFTPHLPAATMAASDIVKAILFRKLRVIFSLESPFYEYVGHRRRNFELINQLINEVEDSYDDRLPNLEAFLVDLRNAFGEHPIVERVQNALEYFNVYYVLNQFNGVKESYDNAVRPFVGNIFDNVSERLNVINLGWVMASPEVHKANCSRIPALLYETIQKKKKVNPIEKELGHLANVYLGLKTEKTLRKKIPSSYSRSDPSDILGQQIELMNRMHEDMEGKNYKDNFLYCAYRTLHLMNSRRVQDFGDVKVFRPEEILHAIFNSARPS